MSILRTFRHQALRTDRSVLLLHSRHHSSYRPGDLSDSQQAEITAARTFLSTLNPTIFQHRISPSADITFSRSSGPGGQNVNKVSSKATVRLPTSAILAQLPALLHPAILSSRYIAARTESLVIQADDSRKREDNVEACFRKLHALIVDAGREMVPGETSGEQVRRVQKLDARAKVAKKQMKKAHSQKKASRRGGGGDGY